MFTLTIQNAGLGLFVFIVITDLVTLIFDLMLKASGHLTLSEHIWNGWTGLGCFFILWQFLGAAGLALHFFAPASLRVI